MTAFAFEAREGEPLTIESAVFQALGAASTCWENLEAAGVFDSTRCKEIGDALVEWLTDNTFDAAPQPPWAYYPPS